ncbi:MAG TPA: glycosyltransferase [Methylovorus sp.]|nr:glycosyltransferase [Methylovorus sp.]
MSKAVLQICHSYYPPFLDCARQYAALFKGTDYRVVTVYLAGPPDEAVRIGSESEEVLFLGYSSKQIRGLKLGAIARIRELARQYDFAFCIAHRVKPTYVALLATNLHVYSIHHNYNDYKRASRRLLVNWYKSRLTMLCVSNSVRDEMRQHLSNWPVDKISTLYNRIDVARIRRELVSRSDARVHLGLPEDALIFGNVGRLHHDKDQATLIKAFAQALPALPANALLVIIGQGPLEASLKQLAHELHVDGKIQFLGQVPDARRYFKAFDAFILSSDHEPFGMVLLEAMAAELPIVCSDSGGGAEVVASVGNLFVTGDTSSLSASMKQLADNTSRFDSRPMLHQLNDRFSDEAAQQQFFSLFSIPK